ncbi:MAG: hypothetical protein QOC77_2831 [Thermoleophilaceae bacterium]|nr:hypothetical protein [Thermoleophilaceae bacterium]
MVVLAIVILAGGSGGSPQNTKAAAAPEAPPQLPRGGRTIFPRFRVVAYYGAPQDPQLGELGIGTPAHAARKLERQARPYLAGGRRILPAFELISTVASGSPGVGGRYSSRLPRRVLDRYLKAARAARALLILDIQPGHAAFMDEVRALRPYLEQPDVSLALDPEWKVPDGEVPGRVIGSTDAADVNMVSAYVSAIVRAHNLPQKLLVVHQFTNNMIGRKELLTQPPGVALTLNVDGFGDPPNKISKYDEFTRNPIARRFHPGFKLFYHEDTNLISPARVLRLRPRPEFVIYE